MKRTFFAASAAAALLMSGAASAQMFGDTYGTDLDYDRFNAGLSESGVYDAWDTDDQLGLSDGEFAAGMFNDWDSDNDLQITESEYEFGRDRWYGSDYGGAFGDYDQDGSGYIDRTEFGGSWNEDYYSSWDGDSDGLIDETEFGQGLYGASDANEDMVITIEEEGWFEGWFDGDNVEAEIQNVGDVL